MSFQPASSCSYGSNFYIGNGNLGYCSRIINKRLDQERDHRYYNRDIKNYKDYDEPYIQKENDDEPDDEPIEMPQEEEVDPESPKIRGSASKRNKVKLTGKSSFYTED